MIAKWPLEVEIAMGAAPVPIYVSSTHFALRYEVPKFLPRGGHLCMAVLTIAAGPAGPCAATSGLYFTCCDVGLDLFILRSLMMIGFGNIRKNKLKPKRVSKHSILYSCTSS